MRILRDREREAEFLLFNSFRVTGFSKHERTCWHKNEKKFAFLQILNFDYCPFLLPLIFKYKMLVLYLLFDIFLINIDVKIQKTLYYCRFIAFAFDFF
jgi:hypothetical protein